MIPSLAEVGRCIGDDCKQARKENRNVLGHLPTRCGHICGHQVLSGNGINILSSSITSILVGLGLIHVYLKWICLLVLLILQNTIVE